MAEKRTVGEMMRAWRDSQPGKLSQREAADRAGFSQFVWSVYERGHVKDVTLEVALALVKLTAGSEHAITLEMFPKNPKTHAA